MDDIEVLATRAIGTAITVHRQLGPGLLESIYEQALCIELEDAGLTVRRQVAIPLIYRGRDLGTAFRADLVVEGRLLLEIKAVDRLAPIHTAQVLSYLKLLNWRLGLLLNFNALPMKAGIHRVINN